MPTQHDQHDGEQPSRKSLEAASGHLIEWSQVRSRSLLLLIAALASTLVAAEVAEWKRGLDAIVTKLQTNDDDATALAEDANTVTALGRKAS